MLVKANDESLSTYAYVQAIYTRPQGGDWRFLLGQLRWVLEDEPGIDEIYRDYAYISRRVSGTTGELLLNALAAKGYQIAPGFPPLKILGESTCWTEEIVPSDVTGRGFPARRYSARIEQNPSFFESQLIGYAAPFHRSAASHVKDFLGFSEYYSNSDARNGNFLIEVPDTRAAIVLEEDHLSIRASCGEYRLVGQIDGQEPIGLVGGVSIPIDTTNMKDVELWLITKDNEILDYRSSSTWPHRYEPNVQTTAEAGFWALIQQGETETCEFKVFIDPGDRSKATEIEKAVCALSNLKGGTLFIGIDDGGEVVGLEKGLARLSGTRKTQVTCSDYMAAIRKRLRESLRNNQCFQVERAELFGLDIVVIKVGCSPDTNYLLNTSQAYIRCGATSRRMSIPEIASKAANATWLK